MGRQVDDLIAECNDRMSKAASLKTRLERYKEIFNREGVPNFYHDFNKLDTWLLSYVPLQDLTLGDLRTVAMFAGLTGDDMSQQHIISILEYQSANKDRKPYQFYDVAGHSRCESIIQEEAERTRIGGGLYVPNQDPA